MEKDNSHQLELFSDSNDAIKNPARRLKADSFSRRVWGYEKSILIIIALLLVGIVSFSLGVEKGKGLKKTDTLKASVPKEQPILASQNEPVVLKEAMEKLPEGGYTIQVASFKTDAYANKEVEALRKKGFKALTLNKGEHIIVCVGSFTDKEEAQPMLSQLIKYYKDCRIRRL